MIVESCSTCKFALTDDGSENFLCRRYPPQVLVWLNSRAVDPDKEVVMRGQFPIMAADGWCGEWRPKNGALH